MSRLELTTELDNEQTVLELQNNLSQSRQTQWNNVIWKYSQCFDEDTSIQFDNLAEQFDDNDDTDSSESDDEDELMVKKNSILEMSQRWVGICKRMDTSTVCHFCNTLMASNSKCADNTLDNVNTNNIKHCKSIPSKTKDNEKSLMEQYIKETNCGLTVVELLAVKNIVEKKVGDSLKNVGFRLNSTQCANNKALYKKVKEELVNLLELLVIDVSIKSLCVYGEYESWKADKLF